MVNKFGGDEFDKRSTYANFYQEDFYASASASAFSEGWNNREE